MKDTNITDDDKEAFAAIRDPAFSNIALFSAFWDGQPCAVIVAINQNEHTGEMDITPMALMLTNEMTKHLSDHDGKHPGPPADSTH